MALKWCRKCGELLPYTRFFSSKRSLDGLQASCRGCWEAAGLHFDYTFRAAKVSVSKAKKRGRPMKRRPYRSKHNPDGLPPEER